MAILTFARSRRALRLSTLGVVALLGSGCHQLGFPRGKAASRGTPQPGIHPLEIVDAGYCETHWISLAPVFGANGYVEPYSKSPVTIPWDEAGSNASLLQPIEVSVPASRAVTPAPALSVRRFALQADLADVEEADHSLSTTVGDIVGEIDDTVAKELD